MSRVSSAFVVLITLLGLALAPAIAEARCYAFRGKDVRVCVEGSDGAARRRATSVCEEVTGGSCSISGDSGECRRSSSVRCFDGSGTEHSHIDPD